MKQIFKTAVITFESGDSVHWEYIGLVERYYRKEKRYRIQVHVRSQSPVIDHYFESWDKPSIAAADWFIKRAIKDAKVN